MAATDDMLAYPDIQGVLYDLPHVVETAPAALADRGLEGRVRLEGGTSSSECRATATVI
jgi:hypothetical protein